MSNELYDESDIDFRRQETKLGAYLNDLLADNNQIDFDDFEILRFIERAVFKGEVITKFLLGRTHIYDNGNQIVDYKHRGIFKGMIFPYAKIRELRLSYREIHENWLEFTNGQWILKGLGLKLLE